jgi:hypothetical protein
MFYWYSSKIELVGKSRRSLFIQRGATHDKSMEFSDVERSQIGLESIHTRVQIFLDLYIFTTSVPHGGQYVLGNPACMRRVPYENLTMDKAWNP